MGLVTFQGGPWDGRQDDSGIVNSLKPPRDPGKTAAALWVPQPGDGTRWCLYRTAAPYSVEIPMMDGDVYFERSADGDEFGPLELPSEMRDSLGNR